MAVRAAEIPHILVERIEASHPSPANFGADELSEWPNGALKQLLETQILNYAPRASTLVCRGCEQQCHEQVVVRQSTVGPRAYIDCNAGHGRVRIPLDALDQYRTSLRAIATFLAVRLGGSGAHASQHGASYAIGHVKGRHGSRVALIKLSAGRVVCEVGTQSEQLTRILIWSHTGLCIDAKHLRRLADRKEPSTRGKSNYQPDHFKQEDRSRKTRKRNSAIVREAKRLRAGGLLWVEVARKIAGTAVAGELKATAVRRIISAELKFARKKWAQNTGSPTR